MEEEVFKAMEIKVKVKTNAPKNAIFRKERGIYLVAVKESPEKGMANQAVIKLLSKYFKKPVKIVRGFRNKQKIIRIEV